MGANHGDSGVLACGGGRGGGMAGRREPSGPHKQTVPTQRWRGWVAVSHRRHHTTTHRTRGAPHACATHPHTHTTTTLPDVLPSVPDANLRSLASPCCLARAVAVAARHVHGGNTTDKQRRVCDSEGDAQPRGWPCARVRVVVRYGRGLHTPAPCLDLLNALGLPGEEHEPCKPTHNHATNFVHTLRSALAFSCLLQSSQKSLYKNINII